uniref:1,3-beta-glucan synthase n=1 Tax=Albugo laibachii Nc14 TaxID=890382 RepID=F0WF25_9STRA|nr:unnamed protein product [Albugo laibachii Nc14]|eukprot:CCA19807.1 unnamed protein product [Albugo laibachii Nc14]
MSSHNVSKPSMYQDEPAPPSSNFHVATCNYSIQSDNLKSLDDIIAELQVKFSFQKGNCDNQKEHLHCLLVNTQSKQADQESGDAIHLLHSKLLKNYHRWCGYLKVAPFSIANESFSTNDLEKDALYQLALYLLIWGEAGNLRFMPECLCFIYHSLAPKLRSIPSDPTPAFESFLVQVIVPIYTILIPMRQEANASALTSSKKLALDHKNITNYDDVNEFFWSKKCLSYDALNVSEAMTWQELKTFKERRSVLNPFLAFYRIYFFLFVMLHTLIVIAYVGYFTNQDTHQGFAYYSNFMDSEYGDLRKHAFLSILVTHTSLSTIKVVLEVWIGGVRIFLKLAYALALFVRFIWHCVFCALFWAVHAAPNEIISGSTTYLEMGTPIAVVYLLPVIFIAAVRMLGGNEYLWNRLSVLHAFDGTKQQYIGQIAQMKQPFDAFLHYALFWTVIFVGKFLFNLQVMIKPLIGPSFELYQIVEPSDSARWLSSGHNILFILAMWAPTILVYIYDTQIWLAILQSLVGAFIGVRLNIGHSSRISEFVYRLECAPKLFDDKIVTQKAKLQFTARNSNSNEASAQSGPGSSYVDQRLRFGIVWNEIISGFRLSDLLDDRESAILQYQIADNGAVEDPVFLLAGRAQKAITIAVKARNHRADDYHLYQALGKAGVLACARNCAEIGFHVLRSLLGNEDVAILETLQELLMNGKVQGVLNLSYLALLRDNVVNVLASVLDMPDPILLKYHERSQEDSPDIVISPQQVVYRISHKHVLAVVNTIADLIKVLELMFEEEWMAEKVRQSVFAKVTPDLTYQKLQIIAIFADQTERDDSEKVSRVRSPQKARMQNQANDDQSASSPNENTISWSTRLFFLLTLDTADSLPRCSEAQRRMSFFLNSLSMEMPSVPSIASMQSFSVITPYYNESVLYSIEELHGRVNANPLFRKVEHKDRDLSILKYLVTFHSDEWGNFLERVGLTSMEEALAQMPTQVRLWASSRGQTLARTVQGIMMYEDALRMLRWLEVGSDPSFSHKDKIRAMEAIAGLKFTYITSCQLYSQQVVQRDPRAQDINLLMQKYPNWRVSFVDPIPLPDKIRYDCVLVKAEGDEIVEVYRYELPGNPMIGEGKPENQNIALPFTRGEYVQTIDMNQEHYFEEALKMGNFLATASEDPNVKIIGMKEHIFTGRASSLAQFMTLQELVFVSLTQRVLAHPLRSRMHYGHPDVFDKSFVISNGGVSKASKGINLSEDVFSGYNAALRGGRVTHIEFMQCGKGRDVTLSQINAFEAKLANGCAESSLSRDAYRMGRGMDFFRLNSMFYGHMGFYICNALTVLCVFCYAYSKLYISLHEDVQLAAITKTDGLDNLAQTLNTQFIFQFGLLMTIPLVATLFVEFGWRQAVLQFIELLVTLGSVFYIFETGTKAHFYDVSLMRGGSKYRGTGRGFAIVRETLVSFFKEYAASHYRKAMELLGMMILFGIFGHFSIGTRSLEDYCRTSGIPQDACNNSNKSIPENVTLLDSYGSKGQDYGIASFAVWLLGACWLLAPFVFNTDGLDFAKTRVDIANWISWMMTNVTKEEAGVETTSGSGPSDVLPHGNKVDRNSDTWTEFWRYETDTIKDMRWKARVAYALREFRHPFFAYQVFLTYFKVSELPILCGLIAACMAGLWFGTLVLGRVIRTQKLIVFRGCLYFVCVFGGYFGLPLAFGALKDWSLQKSMALTVSNLIGMYALLQYFWILHGACGVKIAHFGFVQDLAFFFDMVLGAFLVVPLFLLSAIPFMRTIQTRMMYNGGFSRALSSGSEFAASISVVVGLLAGTSHGWFTALVFSLGFVNDPADGFINQSFVYFVNTILHGDFDYKMLKVYAALASALGAVLCMLLGHFVGRRATLSGAIIIIIIGAAILFIDSSFVITLGVCVVAFGCAMLSLVSVLYNFEICMHGWKGKGVLLFLLGSSFGYLVESAILERINASAITKNWSNKPMQDWRYQLYYGSLPLLLLLFLLRFFPESPVWLYRHQGPQAAEAVLVRLRQKHDVSEETNELQKAFGHSRSSHQAVSTNSETSNEPKPSDVGLLASKKVNLWFRLGLAILVQAAFAVLNSSSLLQRVPVQYSHVAKGDKSSKWMIYFGLMSFIGVMLSLMSVDTVRRKTILKDILPFTCILSSICGILSVAKYQDSVLISIILVVLFAGASLSLTCATWLTAIEIFPLHIQSRFLAISFAVYYLVQALVYLTLPSFALSHFIFVALCGILTVILFTYCASSKTGAIQLKSEKAATIEESMFEDNLGFEDIPSRLTRASRSQSFLRSRQRQTSSHFRGSVTPHEGAYETLNSPAVEDRQPSSVRQSKQNSSVRQSRQSKARVSHLQLPTRANL